MRWIDFVKQYAGEKGISMRDAMKDPACKEAYKGQKMEGGLIGPAIRRDYKPEIRSLLKKIGGKKIESIVIQRVPIESALRGALDVISLGGFSKATKKLGYDDVFHLSMIVGLEGLKKPVVVEKNEVINISYKIPPLKEGGERLTVPVTKSLTLDQMLEATQSVQGSNFFLYHPANRNCQMFIRDLLKNSGLLTADAEAFIMQDAKEIFKRLPSWSEAIAKGVTDLGAQWDRIFYGKGARQSK